MSDSIEPAAQRSPSRPADERPFDHTPIDTSDLSPTPIRDRNISATAWNQAPDELLTLGDYLDIGPEATAYKRRIGPWLLWRAGPSRGPARYLAIDSEDLTESCTFTLGGDEPDHGVGPSGTAHTRFRAWKEELLGRTPEQG